MEHLFNPAKAWSEIYRTLKPGGIYIHTFPIIKSQVDAAIIRAERNERGDIIHLKPEQYHGNPIDNKGALVTLDYGYDVHHLIARSAPFSVRIIRFSDRYRGILGEHTEVIVCEKNVS